MITKDAALQIAEDVVRSRYLGTGVSSIRLFGDLDPRPSFYAAIAIDRPWIGYVARPLTNLPPSLIAAIDRTSGAVGYAGSAHDED